MRDGERKDGLLTSVTMIGELQSGAETDAWRRFLKIYGPLMARWNMDHGVQSADAADVAQEVALFVFNNIHKFDRRHPGAFRAWLRAIAVNKIRRLRSGRNEAGLDASGAGMCVIAIREAPGRRITARESC